MIELFLGLSMIGLILFLCITIWQGKRIERLRMDAARQNCLFVCSGLTKYGIPGWKWCAHNRYAIFGGTSQNTIVVFDVFGKEVGEIITPGQFDYFTVTENELELTTGGSKSTYALKDIRWYGSELPFSFPTARCEGLRLVRKEGFLMAATAGRKRLLRWKQLFLWTLTFVLCLLLLALSIVF